MHLEEGQIIEGKITRVVSEAAFVDIGTKHEAVIARKDLDELDSQQLQDIQAGNSIKVRVVRLPGNTGHPLVSASRLHATDPPPSRRSDQDPWRGVEDQYQEGDLVTGTIKNVKKYGAFVELPIGVDGLIHVSEMQEEFTPSPWNVVQPGEQVTVRITRIEPARRRIRLSLIDVDQNQSV